MIYNTKSKTSCRRCGKITLSCETYEYYGHRVCEKCWDDVMSLISEQTSKQVQIGTNNKQKEI
jgi:recombinational DNA repair protein (RecF pathway)